MEKCQIVPILWKDDTLFLLDQRILPHKEEMLKITTLEGAHSAIKDMVVRGAPCIGFTAILGMALWCKGNKNFNYEDFKAAGKYLKTARPTAVNLVYEVDRTINLAKEGKLDDLYNKLVMFGLEEMELSCKRNFDMALAAEKELFRIYGDKKLRLMTHCNTGHLACGTLGTALGVISHLNDQGKVENVWVDETRPYLQGSRLTSYELKKQNIEHHIVVEGAASYLMQKKLVDAIFVGADRIVSNGDTANKVGTSTLAIVAKHYGVPFFVAAPVSSFDLKAKSGDEIDIELRDDLEVLNFAGKRVAPLGTKAFNPSFDVTRNELISAIFCEKGILTANYFEKIKNLRS